MKKLQKLRQDEGGELLLEFAISALILMTTVLGAMDCARALYIYHFVSYAAQEGARYAIVRGARWSGTTCATTTSYACDATNTNVSNYVQSIVPPGVIASNLTVNTSWPGKTVTGSTTGCSTSNSDGCMVEVQVSYSFSFAMAFMPKPALNFAATAEQVIQD